MKNNVSFKKATIRDIASMTSFSHTTVSRVLNGNANVRESTREQVLDAINKMGFTPNPMAKALSRSRTNQIGLVVSDISNSFYLDIIRGVEDELTRRGLRLVLHSTSALLHQQNNFDFLLGAGIDGFIVLSAHINDPMVETLAQNAIPTVLVHRSTAGRIFSTVSCNQTTLTRTVMHHLHRLGRRRIAIITGSRYNSTADERHRAYRESLKDFGLSYQEGYTYFGRCFRENGIEATRQFLSLSAPPDAIFASSDTVALGVMDVLFEAGMSIPRDISVVGSDNAEFAANQFIGLTSVDLRKREMGSMGAEILLDTLEKKRQGCLHDVKLEPVLVVRRSCGAGVLS
jgi:LacI family transcriptional regulator